MSVFEHQDLLTIRLDTAYDLSTIISVKILYQKPDGTRGEWNATIDGTYVVYQVADQTILDQCGTWKFQSLIIADDGKQAPGEIVSYNIKESLKNL